MTRPARLGSTALAVVLLTACATPGSPGSTPGPAPGTVEPAGGAAPDPPPADGELVGNGTVLQVGDAPPQFCLGGVMESYPPQCSGPPIANWDWNLAAGSETASGVTWGAYALTGTWDGTAFTRTGAPTPPALHAPAPFEDLTAGRQGTTHQAELDRIQQEIQSGRAGDVLTTGTERGFVVVTVVHDDGSLQARMDAEYGADVVVVLSALEPKG